MTDIKDNISKLKLQDSIYNILKENGINKIEELWTLKRKELKQMGLKDIEIKEVIISLQLLGLDLNKKKYN